MGDRATLLRRLIALYRGYLGEGVEGTLAALYLRGIRAAEEELEQITSARNATLKGADE